LWDKKQALLAVINLFRLVHFSESIFFKIIPQEGNFYVTQICWFVVFVEQNEVKVKIVDNKNNS
jgi:hypothetical protein